MQELSRSERIAGLVLRASFSGLLGALFHYFLPAHSMMAAYPHLANLLEATFVLSLAAGTIAAWTLIALRIRKCDVLGRRALAASLAFGTVALVFLTDALGPSRRFGWAGIPLLGVPVYGLALAGARWADATGARLGLRRPAARLALLAYAECLVMGLLGGTAAFLPMFPTLESADLWRPDAAGLFLFLILPAMILEIRMRRFPAPASIRGRDAATALILPFLLLLALVCIEEPTTSGGAVVLRSILGGHAEFVIMALLGVFVGLFLRGARSRVHARLGEVLPVLLLGTALMATFHPSTGARGGLVLAQVFGAAVVVFAPLVAGAFWGWSAAARLGEARTIPRLLLLAAGLLAVPGLVAFGYCALWAVDQWLDRIGWSPWPMLGALLVIPAWAVERRLRRASAAAATTKVAALTDADAR